jgi:hypothetical protein
MLIGSYSRKEIHRGREFDILSRHIDLLKIGGWWQKNAPHGVGPKLPDGKNQELLLINEKYFRFRNEPIQNDSFPYFMTKCFFSLSLLFSAMVVFAQAGLKKNTIYLELAGNGIWASVNYERQLAEKPGLGFRLGLGYYSGDSKFRLSIPVGVNYLFPILDDKSFIDAGIGATWSGAVGLKTPEQEAVSGRNFSEHIWSFIPSLGFRRHTKGNYMWRVSFTPIINKYRVITFPGVSFGKRL